MAIDINLNLGTTADTSNLDKAKKKTQEVGEEAEKTKVKLAKMSSVYSQLASAWKTLGNKNIGSANSNQNLSKQIESVEKASSVTESALEELREATNKVNYELAKTKTLSEDDTSSIKKLAKASSVYSQMISSQKVMGNKDIKATQSWTELDRVMQSLKGKTNVTTEELDRLRDVTSKVKYELTQVPNEAKKTSKSFKEIGKAVKHSTGWLSKFATNIKRIVLYRLIRSAMSGIAKSFKEGADNLYEYSRALKGLDSLNAKGVLDSMATIGQTIKNTLGVTAVSVLKSMLPIIESISAKFVELANNINAVMSAFMGNTTYTVANANAFKEYSAAVDKAKKSLQGFDELNNISSSSGGSGSNVDYKNMFKESELPKWLQDNADKVEELKKKFEDIKKVIGDIGTSLKIGFTDILFDGKKDENGTKVKMAALLNTIAGAAIGFSVGGIGGAVFGAIIGFSLTALLDGYITQNGGVSGNYMGLSLANVLNAIGGGIIGFAIGGVKGALWGATIGFNLNAIMKAFSSKNGGATANSILTSLCGALPTIFGGATLGWKVGGLKGAAIGLTIGLGISFVLNRGEIVREGTNAINKALGRDISFDESFNSAFEEILDTAFFSTLKGATPISGFKVSKHALGGFPSIGSLFIAGESGAEFVGNFGGRTGVASGGEVTGIREAIYEVGAEVLSAMSNPTVIEGDMAQFFRAFRREETTHNRRLGRA